MVEVVGLASEGIELLALGKEGGGIERRAGFGEGSVADCGVFRCDQGNEHRKNEGKDLAGHRDEFDERGHDFVTTVTGKGHSELCAEEAVGFTDIEADALDLAREEAFAAGG